MKRFLTGVVMAIVAVATGFAGGTTKAAEVSGAGATFPYPIYAKWADAYKKETGVGLNYQSIGSGGGIKQIQAKTVTFGASDMPLAAADLDKDGLIQFPMVMGGVVPVVNIPGVSSDQIVLDGKTLADLFLGKITKWNDPAIAKLNPDQKLPSSSIAIVHRSDGSGTTFIFVDYLSKVSAEWKDKVGASTSVAWPTGIGAKGNEGVANNVMRTRGALGYVEYAYAKQNKLTQVRMINRDGKAVSSQLSTFQAAAAGADWAGTPGYRVILTDQPGQNSWPISGATFILLHKNPKDPALALEALKFFDWAFRKGDKLAEELDYIPMPDAVVSLVKKTWSDNVKGTDGKPLFKEN